MTANAAADACPHWHQARGSPLQGALCSHSIRRLHSRVHAGRTHLTLLRRERGHDSRGPVRLLGQLQLPVSAFTVVFQLYCPPLRATCAFVADHAMARLSPSTKQTRPWRERLSTSQTPARMRSFSTSCLILVHTRNHSRPPPTCPRAYCGLPLRRCGPLVQSFRCSNICIPHKVESE